MYMFVNYMYASNGKDTNSRMHTPRLTFLNNEVNGTEK